jgi:hypothetical protein
VLNPKTLQVHLNDFELAWMENKSNCLSNNILYPYTPNMSTKDLTNNH